MRDKSARWRLILPLALLMLAVLACGGFQVRVTPAPATPTASPEAATPEAGVTLTAAPTEAVAATATITATAAPTAAPAQPGALAVGGTAKVTVTGGLNMREQADRQSRQVGKLNSGAIVTIIGGPSQADDYTWWQVDDGKGLKGWVAEGSGADKWLVPEAPPAAGTGGATSRLVNRPIQLGDTVQVTTGGTQVLTIRQEAGLDAAAVARALNGTEFVVRGGPVRQDELTWWHLENDQMQGWAAEGRGEDRWLTPVER
jgi:hypothetical protein